MINFLKKSNRTFLELWSGMIVFTAVCQIAVCIFSRKLGIHSASLWIGTILALLASLHMYRSLDRALDFPEGTAKKKITFSYVLRYAAVVAAFAVICITGFFNPLLSFLQPQTHKVYNRIFNETDPVPMTEEEYKTLTEAKEAENIKQT